MGSLLHQLVVPFNATAFTVFDEPTTWGEVLGFVTGVWCVWLVVRRNVWNWPVGIANNVFFLLLFVEAGLFADSALQVVYLVLGFYGWWAWVRGGVTGPSGPFTDHPRSVDVAACYRRGRHDWAGLVAREPYHLDGTRGGLVDHGDQPSRYVGTGTQEGGVMVAVDRCRSDLRPAVSVQGPDLDCSALPGLSGALCRRPPRLDAGAKAFAANRNCPGIRS